MQKNQEIKQQPGYYSILTANVRYDKRLSAQEKIMYSEITALSNMQGYCNASNKYFADLYDVSKETVSRWLSKLKKFGYVEIEIVRAENQQIISRSIYTREAYALKILNESVPSNKGGIDENINTPIDENVNTPIDENVKANSIYSFNIKKEEEEEEEKATNVTVALSNEQLELVALFEEAKDSKASSKEIREIQKLSKENDIELLKYLMQRLTDKNAKMTYINTVLKDWQNNTLKTVHDVESHLQSINKAKSKSSKSRQDSARQSKRVVRREPTPAWLSDMNGTNNVITEPSKAVLSETDELMKMKDLMSLLPSYKAQMS